MIIYQISLKRLALVGTSMKIDTLAVPFISWMQDAIPAFMALQRSNNPQTLPVS